MPGFWELMALGILALLIFGPDRLPGVLRSFGRTVGNVRREARTALDELKSASDLDEVRNAAEELRAETDALRQESREASRVLSGAGDEGRRRPARTSAAAGDRAAAGDAAASEPAPFDPDAP